MDTAAVNRKARSRRKPKPDRSVVRDVDYRNLRNPFVPQRVLSDDRLNAIHDAALKVLQELGIKVLDDEARRLFREAGAEVDQSEMVRLERGLVEGLLDEAPGEFDLQGATGQRPVHIGGDSIAFAPVGGPPYVSDLERGKRSGTLEDLQNFFRLAQHFDVIHILSPSVEPQDVALELRHMCTTRSQLELSAKPPFIFARGPAQVRDCLEMLRLGRGLDQKEFERTPCCYTVINTNSPRQLDVPMCQGIIDFARAGQPAIITPFTLSGAMAPVTIAGALTLQHAEAMAGIALSQIVRPGSPVIYGSFTSNVDMKSGSPAFGTPEFVQGAIGAGQLARRIGLPWRGSAATVSNAPDEQGTYETMASTWGGVMGGINLMMHSAGWLEGGLTASYEKFILDVEALQILAEAMQPLEAGDAAIAYEAIAETEPGGHFFAAQHTMQRYQTAFYQPLLSDWRNFGDWSDDGSKTAAQRAGRIWRQVLDDFDPPALDPARAESVEEFVARRCAEGGALPLS